MEGKAKTERTAFGLFGRALMALAACAMLVTALATQAQGGPFTGGTVTATAETQPVPHSGDAADDPAIWRDASDPSRSVLIETDKGGSLLVRDLNTGSLIQRIDGPLFNNVDLRSGFPLGGSRTTIVVASRQDSLQPAIYSLDSATRKLTNVSTGFATTLPNQYGTCMYRMAVTGSPDRFFFFTNSEKETTGGGEVEQWELKATSTGKVSGTKVRSFDVGGQTEGCVVDDANRALYIGEELVGIWRYGAAPGAGTTRTKVDGVGTAGNLVADVEGLTLALEGDGGHLIASSQGESAYAVYDRVTNAFQGKFKIGGGNGIDGVGGTDGIDVLSGNVGPKYPNGVFVAQDGTNMDGSVKVNQNFKLVDYADLFGGTSPAPTDADGDGVSDADDACPNTTGPASNGGCPVDSPPPSGDTDTDGDGVPDSSDNCPTVYNTLQNDADGDGLGNQCDSDIDGDGYENGVDAAPNNPNIH